MDPQAQDMRAVLERLDKLERENQKLRRLGVLTLLVITGLVLMGESPTSKTADIVRARRFVLEDADGKTQGYWFVSPYGPVFDLSDLHGNHSAVSAGGIKLERHVQKESKPYVLTTVAHVPSLELMDEDGFMTAIGATGLLQAETGETRKTSAASIVMSNKDEKVIWRAP
jgi:hypothetical protein